MEIFQYTVARNGIQSFIEEVIDGDIQWVLGLGRENEIVFQNGIPQILAEHGAVEIVVYREIADVDDTDDEQG